MAAGNQTGNLGNESVVCSFGPVLGQTMGMCPEHSFTNFICREVGGVWVKVCEKCEAHVKLHGEEDT